MSPTIIKFLFDNLNLSISSLNLFIPYDFRSDLICVFISSNYFFLMLNSVIWQVKSSSSTSSYPLISISSLKKVIMDLSLFIFDMRWNCFISLICMFDLASIHDSCKPKMSIFSFSMVFYNAFIFTNWFSLIDLMFIVATIKFSFYIYLSISDLGVFIWGVFLYISVRVFVFSISFWYYSCMI